MERRGILLITDSIPCSDGGGISQTLYNLLINYPGEIFILTKQDEKLPTSPSLSATVHKFNMQKFRPWTNRLGKYVNAYVAKINHILLDHYGVSIPDSIDRENLLVLVSTTDPIKLHFAFCIYKKYKFPILPYFMDDWLFDLDLRWMGSSIHNIAKELLDAAKTWLMISENLYKTFLERYKLKDRPCLIIHNPALETNSIPTFGGDVEEGLIIYAGSIWPMHLDALIVTAKAISKLHLSGQTQYRLKIYANPIFWETNKKELQIPGVIFGGFVAYQELQQYLQKGWLLLVSSSFAAKNRSFSFSSVQTKLTDYMAAARPILFVGPSDAASGDFVRKWDCGFCFHSEDHLQLSEELVNIMNDRNSWLLKATKGKKTITEHFSREVVQNKLYQFVTQNYN